MTAILVTLFFVAMILIELSRNRSRRTPIHGRRMMRAHHKT